MTKTGLHSAAQKGALLLLAVLPACGADQTDAPSEQNPLSGLQKDRLQSIVTEKALFALNYIARVPSLAPFIESAFDAAKPRVKLELCADASALGQQFGMRGFQGDSLTRTAFKPATGEFFHTMYIQDTCFRADGKLLVVMLHEFVHMQRREQQIPLTSAADEEVAAFQRSNDEAENLMRQLERTAGESTTALSDRRVAQEIREALVDERRLLASWLRMKR